MTEVRSSRLLLLALCLLLSACQVRPPAPTVLPPTAGERIGGPQSEPTPRLRALVKDLAGLPPQERLRAMLRRVSEVFVFDPWQNNAQLSHTADELAAGRSLGDCGAYALMELALVRALDLPARLVLTADADWLKRYRADGLSMTSGHAFIEVWAEGRWWLLDPTYFEIYDDYQPDRLFYPRRQIFVARGLDFHDLGLRTMDQLQNFYAHAARSATLSSWQEPPLTTAFTLPIHPPALLTAAAQLFLGQQRFPEAEERLAKALTQAPGYPPALLARGRLSFLRRDYAAALADFNQAIEAMPTDPTGYLWRAHTHNGLGRRDRMCADLARACTLGRCEEQTWARGEHLCPMGGGSEE